MGGPGSGGGRSRRRGGRPRERDCMSPESVSHGIQTAIAWRRRRVARRREWVRAQSAAGVVASESTIVRMWKRVRSSSTPPMARLGTACGRRWEHPWSRVAAVLYRVGSGCMRTRKRRRASSGPPHAAPGSGCGRGRKWGGRGRKWGWSWSEVGVVVVGSGGGRRREWW
jgi:hypothetical protein